MRGEHGQTLVFWKFREITDTDSGEAKTIPMVPAYTVFNVEQCDGLDKVKAGEFPLSVEPDHVIGWCQSIGATIRHGAIVPALYVLSTRSNYHGLQTERGKHPESLRARRGRSSWEHCPHVHIWN